MWKHITSATTRKPKNRSDRSKNRRRNYNSSRYNGRKSNKKEKYNRLYKTINEKLWGLFRSWITNIVVVAIMQFQEPPVDIGDWGFLKKYY